jgi:glycosyltransferase involved in cell wall biosynthesis
MAHVLLVNGTGAFSGAESVLITLSVELISNGHKVSLMCPEGDLLSRIPDSVEVLCLPQMSPSGSSKGAKILGLLSGWISGAFALRKGSKSADVVLFNNITSLPASVLLGKKRTVWLVHDVIGDSFRRSIAWLFGRRMTLIVAVSESAAAPIRKLVNPQAVAVVKNGTAVPSEAEVEKFKKTRIPNTMGCLSAIVPWKGHRVLLEALAQLRDMPFVFEIAGKPFPGDEDYLTELKDSVQALGLADRVFFVGHIAREEVLGRWSCMILPSVQPEAMPLSVLECMAVEMPVISTNHGGSRELLADSRGVLVEPGNVTELSAAIRESLIGTRPQELMAVTARQFVKDEHDLQAQYRLLASVTLGDFVSKRSFAGE